MRRVTEPLAVMGARIAMTDGRLPITITGGALRGIKFKSSVASAQVKTAVLLAGIQATGETLAIEPYLSRNHSELLLPAFGVPISCSQAEATCQVSGPSDMDATDIAVPGDPSSAAFLLGAAVLVPGSEVVLPDVDLNPTRLGFVRVLQRMGADVDVEFSGLVGGERVGTMTALFRDRLDATVVTAAEAPSLIDEVPLLAVVATSVHGTTRFEGMSELRVKETDRLEAIAVGLERLGATVRTGDDWLEIDGPVRLRGGSLYTLGDHRLAMAWAVSALVAAGPVTIEGFECVDVSYPRFAQDLAGLIDSRGM
jgi:3-phosphoshikimate 1-carboxyvinyltransferase